jgi:hypothetical protein
VIRQTGGKLVTKPWRPDDKSMLASFLPHSTKGGPDHFSILIPRPPTVFSPKPKAAKRSKISSAANPKNPQEYVDYCTGCGCMVVGEHWCHP